MTISLGPGWPDEPAAMTIPSRSHAMVAKGAMGRVDRFDSFSFSYSFSFSKLPDPLSPQI